MVHHRLTEMSKVCPVILSIGNHDMEDSTLGASSIDTFDAIPGVYVMGGTAGYSMLEIRDMRILGVQYFHKTEDFKRAFEAGLAEYPNPDVVMMHQGIDDFNGTGMPDTKLTCEYIKSKTDAWVLCGHYHFPNRNGKIINVGAPLQHTFGDEGSERGCWTIDTDGGAKFYPLNVTPKFKTIRDKGDIKDVAGCFVRIIAKTLRSANALQKAAEDAGALFSKAVIDKEYTTAHAATVKATSDPKMMIGDFCKLVPRLEPHTDKIVAMWERVCL